MDEHWQVLQGDWHGQPILVRLNLGARGHIRDPRYQFRLGISVPLHTPEENGLPTEAEETELYAIEDRLAETLSAGEESLFTAVVTTSGQREFAFYTCSPETAVKKATSVKEETAGHKLKIVLQQDGEWRGFKQFLTSGH